MTLERIQVKWVRNILKALLNGGTGKGRFCNVKKRKDGRGIGLTAGRTTKRKNKKV
jgi:hypothetical protein